MGDALAAPVWLTIRQAAERSGTSMDTVRRAVRAGRFPTAMRQNFGDRGWRISVADLVDAGFHLGQHPASVNPPADAGVDVSGLLAESRADVGRLHEENATLRTENARLREHTLALLDRLVLATGERR